MSGTPKEVDVLVIGGGLSGLSTALHACEAQPGIKVLVIEKTDALGGSSQYSSGMFWAPRSVELAHKEIPFGDPELQQAIVQEHPEAVQWLRDQGIRVSDVFKGIMSIGVGYPMDIHALLRLLEKRILQNPNATILRETCPI